MRYATVTSPKGIVFFVRIDKEHVATPIKKAFEIVGLDPFRFLIDQKISPLEAQPIDDQFSIYEAKKYFSPITAPSKVISIGANYKKHIEETNLSIPTEPVSFGKFPNALIGHNENIRYRLDDTKQVDYENELMIIIGKQTKDVTTKEALNHVFGYTIVNDITARDHQFKGDQYSRCKSFDTFMPVGPWIVDKTEIPNPQILSITTRLNGKIVQDSNTQDQLFSCSEIISFLSRYITLEPGDMITTGTPEGVGWGRKPQTFLNNGDILESEIEGIGVLKNPIKVI
tara:strand:- start:355 stop:1209 length:855 start_codon:yes stop_codon:yes gene_type:complete